MQWNGKLRLLNFFTFCSFWLLYFLCLSALLTVCPSALDLQGVISDKSNQYHMNPGPQQQDKISQIPFPEPCRLHNAVLTTVTFLRVLSYNYSSFPLSPSLQSTSSYLHNTCPNTHIVDTAKAFTSADYYFLQAHTPNTIHTHPLLYLCFYSIMRLLYSHFATSKTTLLLLTLNCDWKDWHSTV